MSKGALIAGFLAALFTAFIYLPALENDFVNLDDNMYIHDNPRLKSIDLKSLKTIFLSFYASNYHPLTLLSHAMDYAIWGLAPMGHHLTNIILHALNTFLVVMLIALLLKRANLPDMRILTASAVTGILFGIHPLHVESVAWVSERKDVLYAVFYLLGILSYLRYASMASRKWYVLTLILFSLSLMSKPMAVTLPVVLLIIDWHPLGRLGKGGIKKIILEKIPFFVLSLASAIMALLAQRGSGAVMSDIPLFARLLVGAKSLIIYLEKMIYPNDLIPYYPYPGHASLASREYLTPVLLIAIIAGASVFMALKGRKLWLALLGYYLVSLLPVLGIIQVGSQSMADRYAYLASMGPFLLAGLGTAMLIEKIHVPKKPLRKIAIILPALIAIASLSYSTVKQIRIWKNSLTLWNAVIKVEPEFFLPYNMTGRFYLNKGQTDSAIRYFSKAIALWPDYAEAYNNLGAAYGLKGMTGKAIECFRHSLRLRPDYLEAHFNIAIAYASEGLSDKAIEHYLKTVELNPDYAEAHYRLGQIYFEQKDLYKARLALETALSINPRHGKARKLLNSLKFTNTETHER